MNRINRKISELKKQCDSEVKPKLSEAERVRNDFAVMAPIPMPGVSPAPAAEINRRQEPKKAVLVEEEEKVNESQAHPVRNRRLLSGISLHQKHQK